MRKFIQRNLPSPDSIKQNRWLRPFGFWLRHPNIWRMHRRSVAGGVAIGLFCGLIPGPLQMISAAILAVLFRVNLPVAAFATLYTNPLTIVPLYLLAYRFGEIASGTQGDLAATKLTFPQLHWYNWTAELWDWLMLLGRPLLIGLPLLALGLAVVGYVTVRVVWRLTVVLRWRARKHRRND